MDFLNLRFSYHETKQGNRHECQKRKIFKSVVREIKRQTLCLFNAEEHA